MTSFSTERIFSQIKSETTKYSDISNVFQKLQDSGAIKGIYELFSQIFVQEKKYTFEELSKIMQTYPNKKFNLENQLKLNGAIFKANFQVIVDIMIDMLSNEVYNSEANNQLISAQNSLSEINKSLNASSQRLVSPTLKSPKNVKKPAPKHFKEKGSPRGKSQKGTQGLSTSMVVTRDDAKAFKKRKMVSKGEIPANTSNIIPTNTSFYSQKNLRMNQSTNSFYSPNVNNPNLDSEFSYLGGKSTFSFSRTERLKEPKETSPGPHKYDPEKASQITRKKSPDVKFDKAEKTSWFDEKFKAGSQSPGFIYNPSKHFASK